MLVPANTTTARPEQTRTGAASTIGNPKPASTATIVVNSTGPMTNTRMKISVDGGSGGRLITGARAKPGRGHPNASATSTINPACARTSTPTSFNQSSA